MTSLTEAVEIPVYQNCNPSMIDQLPLNKSKLYLIEELSKKLSPAPQLGQSRSQASSNSPDDNDSFFTRIKNRLKNYATRGKRKCAKGVRNILNALFNKNVDSGPPAKKYNQSFLSQWKTANSCYKESPDNGSTFKNYDIRVLKPKNPKEAGHIEIYLDGTWYSDFKQRISLWNGGNSKYSQKTLYRFSNCKTAMLNLHYIHLIAQHFLSEAMAEDKEIEDDETAFPSKVVLLAESAEWMIKEVFADQGSDFILYKKGNAKEEIKISVDSNSIYSLIYDIKDKNLQVALAKDALKNWIKRDGRSEVQKSILSFEALTALQRDTYLKSGLNLPKKYSIYPK